MVAQLPTWLMADRAVSRFERMMSLYDVHVENFLKTVGPFNALDLLKLTLEGKSMLKIQRARYFAERA